VSDENPRVVKSQSGLDRCSGLEVHLGAPGSTVSKAGSADHKPGSTWERQGQACERRPQAWEHVDSLWSRLEKTSSLGPLLVHLEIIATTYRSIIVKTDVFSLYSHLCIYVSI